jgi:hypothetical protein
VPNVFARPQLTAANYAKAAAERDKTFEALVLFIDWRHKIMVRFMLGVVGFVTAWHYLTYDRWQLQTLDLAAGALFAGVMARMDDVNAKHLVRLYERGAALEQLMFAGVGVFGSIRNRQVDADRVGRLTDESLADVVKAARPATASYTWLIAVLYWSTAAVFLVGSAATAVRADLWKTCQPGHRSTGAHPCRDTR